MDSRNVGKDTPTHTLLSRRRNPTAPTYYPHLCRALAHSRARSTCKMSSSNTTGVTYPSESSSGKILVGTFRHEMHGILQEVAHLNLEPLDVGVDLTTMDWLTNPSWEFDSRSWEDVTMARNIALENNEEAEKENSIQDKDRKYFCRLCSKEYKRKNDARIHVSEAHLALYKFFCPFCPHKTSRGWSYDRHMKNVHKMVTDRPKRSGFQRQSSILKRRRHIPSFAR